MIKTNSAGVWPITMAFYEDPGGNQHAFLIKRGVDAFANQVIHFKSICDERSYALPKKPALLRVSEVNTTDLSDLEISPFRSAALNFFML